MAHEVAAQWQELNLSAIVLRLDFRGVEENGTKWHT